MTSNHYYRVTIKERYNVGLDCDPNWSLDEFFESTGGSPDVLHLIKYAILFILAHKWTSIWIDFLVF